MLRPFGFAQDRLPRLRSGSLELPQGTLRQEPLVPSLSRAQHERKIIPVVSSSNQMISKLAPFALSPSTFQPFVLSLSKETAGLLRTGLSKGERRVFQQPARG